jgi:glycosyltransferase involved in cell wall biosynthesis
LYGLNPRLIIHPVGSDIWQIGPQIKSRVKWLLDSPFVDSILTYSNCFINEIKEYYNIEKQIHVLPPVLEKEKFFQINENVKFDRKVELGFDNEDFIIHHHSSMRKIKCPEIILDIVIKAATRMQRKCILIMAGPIPKDLLKSLNLNLMKLSHLSHFKYKSICKNLTVYWTGIETEVEYLLQISDVELNASLHDSFNISLLEAMACGVPVVTSDVVGISEHILKSNSGYCFPTIKLNFDDLNIALQQEKYKYFDIDYAIDSILAIERNTIKAHSMGEDGARYVQKEFSFENASKEFHKHIL